MSNLLKHFSTRISPVATHQGSKRASSKAKHSDFSEQIPQKQNLKLKSHNSKHILGKEDTQKLCFRQSSQRSSMKTENLPLNKKCKENTRILPFVTQYRPTVPNLKQILMQKWHLIQQQPRLKEIFKDPPIVSYKMGRSLNDTRSSQTLNWLSITRG